MIVSDFLDTMRARVYNGSRPRARARARTTPRWLVVQRCWVIWQGVTERTLIEGTRSCFHLYSLAGMCLLPSHGLPHVALQYEGRKSARSPGHQDKGNLSPRLGQLRDHQRTIRAVGARPEFLIVTVSIQCCIECIELTNERDCSLISGAKGRWRGISDTSDRQGIIEKSYFKVIRIIMHVSNSKIKNIRYQFRHTCRKLLQIQRKF